MRAGEVDRSELELLVAEYRRVRLRHAAARHDGRRRRRLEQELSRVERRFDRLLGEGVSDAQIQASWRKHLHNQAPEPPEPSALRPPLAFKGRSPLGSTLEVRQRAEDEYALLVDGAEIERVAAAADLAHAGSTGGVRLGDVVFAECFDASAEAVGALRRFATTAKSRPPFEHARELLADGLVDRHFALTPRGHRAVAALPPAAPTGEFPVQIAARGDVGAASRRRLERMLRRVLAHAPLRVLGVHGVIAHSANPSLERPASVRITVEVRGPDLQVRANARSPAEAVDLAADRLARRLRDLETRREAGRRRPFEGTQEEEEL